MQKIMLMFPGQGSQYVGMGKDLYEKYPAAKNIIEMLGADLKKIMFEGTEEDLKNTKMRSRLFLRQAWHVLKY